MLEKDISELKGTASVDIKSGKKIVGLKSTSYREYLAARVLMNNNFVQQGVILMNTCLEKQIKAYLLTRGCKINIQHNCDKLLTLLNQKYKELNLHLNQDFFKTISKVYLSRYYEQLNPGYNFVILRRKFLAEFDYIFPILDRLVTIKLELNKTAESLYEMDRIANNQNLFTENYILNKWDKTEFLQQRDFVHEFRILNNHGILEALYTTDKSQNDNIFLYKALVPSDLEGKSYTTSHPSTGPENR